MGCFGSKHQTEIKTIDKRPRTKPNVSGLPGPLELKYNREARVTIKQRAVSGKVIGTDAVMFQHTEPILAVADQLRVAQRNFIASSCALPGIDPRGQHSKDCQDNWIYLSDGSSFLVALFDGHGYYGHVVSAHCVKTTKKYYKETKYKRDPNQFLIDLAELWDKQLRHRSYNIDATNSGTTAVFILFYNAKMYCASVGDSRGIVAWTDPPVELPVPESGVKEEDQQTLAMVKRKRMVTPEKSLFAIQITRDQKPEDPEELERIMRWGGRVQRLADEMGNEVGPHRVWKLYEDTPGLAMSRSIGDTIGADIGVIATPVTSEYEHFVGNDSFIVAGSDGIWDVMENSEVCKFVEHYRRHCKQKCKGPQFGQAISASNSCIAQMLCEEARIRWLAIVEHEDVMIDDISAVIIEFSTDKKAAPNQQTVPQKQTPTTNKSSTQKDDPALTKPSGVKGRKDPRRGSILTGADASTAQPSNPNPFPIAEGESPMLPTIHPDLDIVHKPGDDKVPRKDPRRGSILAGGVNPLAQLQAQHQEQEEANGQDEAGQKGLATDS